MPGRHEAAGVAPKRTLCKVTSCLGQAVSSTRRSIPAMLDCRARAGYSRAMPHAAPPSPACPGREALTLELAGRTWRIEREGDLESLWNSIADDSDEDLIPYWVEMWPAGVALADHIAAHKEHIAGSLCLDVGCGLALTALAASWVGGKVVAFDIVPEALAFARDNAALNDVPQPLWLRRDLRTPLLRAARSALPLRPGPWWPGLAGRGQARRVQTLPRPFQGMRLERGAHRRAETRLAHLGHDREPLGNDSS